ncbi:Single-stranded DNA-binding protein [Geodia barretti]|uniref:Single-stranded DNA-binding protein n=1 Tax=Geodia barretti TaxID=519541 RepID=A0AA35XHM1_GEOBA|nr:Single-stranded DNA-binding protein [Geodia barretti]
MRYTPSGQAVTSFSVASSRRYRTADGEQREETEWFNVSAFGRLSEICNPVRPEAKQVYVRAWRVELYRQRRSATVFAGHYALGNADAGPSR